ncbi:excisionase family DNA-binding protein [Gordonia terrae]
MPEAAELLSISTSFIRRLHHEGEIAFTKLGDRSTRVHIEKLRSFPASLKTFDGGSCSI